MRGEANFGDGASRAPRGENSFARRLRCCVSQGAGLTRGLFGSRLDCSPHFHALAPDAVFLESEEGDIELWRLPQPTREEVAKLVERIARRTLAMLKKQVGEDLRLDALDRLRAAKGSRRCCDTANDDRYHKVRRTGSQNRCATRGASPSDCGFATP
jgi:hypothetical protein